MQGRLNRQLLIPVLVFAVLLIGGFGILSLRSTIFSTHGESGETWYRLRLFTDQNGWAVTSQGILHTQDSGKHWTIVSPHDFTDKTEFNGLTSDFVDGHTAWIISPSGTHYVQFRESQPAENAHAYHTSDGGKTWQKSDIPDTANTYSDIRSGAGFVLDAFARFSPSGENRRTVSINQITAPDTHSAWVAVSCTNVHTGGGEEIYTHIYSRLWRSRDGGQTWKKAWENTDQKFPNASGAWIIFGPSSTSGLMSGPEILDLFSTHDGINWQKTTLPAQDLTADDLQRSGLEPAVLFNERDGVVALRTYQSGTQEEGEYVVRFFLTHDGGQNWQRVPGSFSVPLARAGSGATIVSYLDRTHWLVMGEDVLLRSDDEGQSWQHYALEQGYSALVSPSFISPLEGWGIGERVDGNTLSSALLHTLDGGKSWEKVDTQVSS